MKALVVYYTRKGATRRVGDVIAKILDADVEEIIDTKSRLGVLGYMRCGFEGNFQKLSVTRPAIRDPQDYDLVIVGTPVWARSLSSPVRTYLTAHGRSARKLAFFCTYGGSATDMAFAQMTTVSGHKPVATLAVRNRQVAKGEHLADAQTFAHHLERLRD